MMKRAIAMALFAGLGVATSAMAQNADWNKVVEAAKREGEVTVYSAYISPTHDAVSKAFTAKYGIKVNMLTALGRVVIERARIEQASGRLIGVP